MGRCPDCGRWNSFVEELGAAGVSRERRSALDRPEKLDAILVDTERTLRSGISEFDRTLGGGLVPGALVLIGGEPGIGKSTLILQASGAFSRMGIKTLYMTGEESLQQIKLRAQRLGVSSEHLYVLSGTCLEDFLEILDDLKPEVVVLDSIQTIYTEALPSAPGSVGQVREVASKLMSWAKGTGTPTFLIGHVTKEGAIAGPKVLEHLVDTVLYFEGDRSYTFRILRAVKNRYGSTNEIGVFEMKETGLEEVVNPSRIFLEERPVNGSGSVVIPCLEGTRPVLVEVQALVGPSPFGMPRRTAVGADPNRINLLVAVLGKRMGLEMGDQDIFVNVAGGLKIEEPAADLGFIAAMISSFLDRPVARDVVVFGEVGLAGEVRAVNQTELRLREAKKLGFSKCVCARTSGEGCSPPSGMEMILVGTVKEVMEALF
jgi:DNA repair protein RadA/Sms